jgi:hypothetical protein
MTIKYARFEVSIHGLDATMEEVQFLRTLIETTVRGVIVSTRGTPNEIKFRGDASDIEVELIEHAGE